MEQKAVSKPNMRPGAFAVIEKDGKILLVRRTDAPVWDLPGGGREKDESMEACVIREAEEETGYQISLTCLIGKYARPAFRAVQYVYLAKIIGGTAIQSGPETNRLKWFSPKRLPLLMVPHRKAQIRDFLRGMRNGDFILKDSRLMISIMKHLKKHI